MNAKRVWIASFVLSFLALILLLAQHWGMTFTNSDDPVIAQVGYGPGILQGSYEEAKLQGRFWLIPIYTLAQLPHVLDSWEVVNAIRIIVSGLVFLSFILFCSKLTNKYAGLLMGVVWLALIDINSSDFSPIHGYLLMFNLQFIFLFFSFYLFLDRIDRTADTRAIVAPYLLYAFAMLAYEPMFFYSLAFPALYLYRQNGTERLSLLRHAVNFLRRNWMLIVVLLGYVVMYFGFRKLLATGTRGIDSGGNLNEIVKTIYLFSIHGFHFELKPLTAAVLEQFSVLSVATALLYAALIGAALLLLIPRMGDEQLPAALYRKSSLLVLVFFTLSPNIMYGFVDGYRKWANYDPHYVGNYFSSFPLAMLITLGLLYLVGGGKARQEKILFALILYLFASAAFDNYLRWEKLADINRRGSAQWQAALRDLDQRSYPHDRATLICAGNTPDHVNGDDKYWSKYLSRRYAADLQFVSRKVSKEGCDVVLDFSRN